MNQIQVYHEFYHTDEWMDNILSIIYGSGMKYLASDLLKEGVSVLDLDMAIQRAMTVCATARIDTRKHFMPVYTQIQGGLIRDCKTSQMGLAMILINANPSYEMVAKWQVKLLEKYFLNDVT